MIISQQNDEIDLIIELPLNIQKDLMRVSSEPIYFKSGDKINLKVRVPYIFEKELQFK